jgi:hypothetical protein
MKKIEKEKSIAVKNFAKRYSLSDWDVLSFC